MLFLLLRPKDGHQFCICDLAIRWDLQQVEKVKWIGACRHAQANALGKAPEVVVKTFDLNGLVRAARKVTVFCTLPVAESMTGAVNGTDDKHDCRHRVG